MSNITSKLLLTYNISKVYGSKSVLTRAKNTDGCLGIGNTNTNFSASSFQTPLASLAGNITRLRSGPMSCAAIDNTGRLSTWGTDYACGQGPSPNNSIIPTPAFVTTVIVGSTQTVSPQWSFVSPESYALAAIDVNGDLYTASSYSNVTGYNGASGYLKKVTTPANKIWIQYTRGDGGANQGNHYAMAITQDGNMYAVGSGTSYQTGLNATTNVTTFTQVTNPSVIWKNVACGNGTSAGIDADGKLYLWGSYSSMPPSMGSSNFSIPTLYDSSRVWKTVVTNALINVFFVIDSDGNLFSFGNNGSSLTNYSGCSPTPVNRFELTPVSIASTVKTIVVSGEHVVAIDYKNQAWGWGYNAPAYGNIRPTVNGEYINTPVRMHQRLAFSDVGVWQFGNCWLTA